MIIKIKKMEQLHSQRMERVMAGVHKFVDMDKVLFVFGKSNNDNCVVFLYDEESEDDNNLLVPMWLHLDPDSMDRHIQQGNPSLMSSLSPVENELMGCKLDIDEQTGKFHIHLKQSGMRDRPFELVTGSDGKAVVISNLSGRTCKIEWGYCVFQSGAILIPDYFIMNGVDVATGEQRSERIQYKV